MSEILSYFGEIIIITAISGILFTVAPEGNIKKYINFIISVCVLAAIVAPMISVVSKLPEKIRLEEWKYEEAGAEESEKIENAVINASKKEIESAICSLLSSNLIWMPRRLHAKSSLMQRIPQISRLRKSGL